MKGKEMKMIKMIIQTRMRGKSLTTRTKKTMNRTDPYYFARLKFLQIMTKHYLYINFYF